MGEMIDFEKADGSKDKDKYKSRGIGGYIIAYRDQEGKERQGALYGDQSVVGMEEMQAQVEKRMAEGVEDGWDGCMRSGKCCRSFSVGHFDPQFAMPDLKELMTAHYGAGNTPNIQMRVQHTCSQLRARKGKDGETETKCQVYDSRPAICQQYICPASHVRAMMFKQKKLELCGPKGEEGEAGEPIDAD